MFNEYSLVLVFVVTTGVISLVLAGIMVFVILFYQRRQFQYREQLSESAHAQQLLKIRVEMQEQTLHLVSQELHDNVGQLLSTTKMFMALTEQSLETVPPPFITAIQTLSHAIKELRSLSKSFSNEWLTRFDLFDNLRCEVDRINSGNTMCAILHAPTGTVTLTAETQMMLFRIIQEAMQNSIKHANATCIEIEIVSEASVLSVKVRDNGVGLHMHEQTVEGMGMVNMRHRTELLRGSIQWLSEKEAGTTVHVIIPIK